MENFLEKLAQLRSQIHSLQKEAEVIMPDAIAEAINTEAKNRVVYQDCNTRIVLCFRKRYLSSEEDTTLSRLDDDILNATAQLAKKHVAEIEQIESQIESMRNAIAALESKRDKLLSSPYTNKLKLAYQKHREETAYLVPSLSVFLK